MTPADTLRFATRAATVPTGDINQHIDTTKPLSCTSVHTRNRIFVSQIQHIAAQSRFGGQAKRGPQRIEVACLAVGHKHSSASRQKRSNDCRAQAAGSAGNHRNLPVKRAHAYSSTSS